MKTLARVGGFLKLQSTRALLALAALSSVALVIEAGRRW